MREFARTDEPDTSPRRSASLRDTVVPSCRSVLDGGRLVGSVSLIALGPFRLAILSGCVVFSVIAFAVYGWDKSAARRGARRIPERTLHLLSLAGGWPGALVAQLVFRHKTIKQPFRAIFWGTVVVNCSGLAMLFAWPAVPR
jgi:uncharacterized membrane protein YsdA (DUF1294 family)